MGFRMRRLSALMVTGLVVVGVGAASAEVLALRGDAYDEGRPSPGEFHFARMIYRDLPEHRRYYGGGWWSQDVPRADNHFSRGLKRLTRVDVGGPVAVSLTSPRLFNYPWLYATQVGYWDLSDKEIAALREYLARGGFLIVDDFWGDEDWQVFQQTMSRLYPNRPIVEITPGSDDEILHVLYDLKESIQIPGLRHLYGYRGRGFRVENLPKQHWRAILDDKGRVIIAINYDMDVGDSWEEANNPRYPEPMTALGYRFGINYTIYAMTH